MIDPTPYLQAVGFKVQAEGRHLSVRTAAGDEEYRLTRPDPANGKWLWCDRYGIRGGDNIDLVQDVEPGISFSDAVFRLYGTPSVKPRPVTPAKREPPKLPRQNITDVDRGRNYLRHRRISEATIRRAEDCGFLRYCNDGILFCGYNAAKQPQNVTRRATNDTYLVQKRDLRGSDKQFAPILHGGNSGHVWIVEGGTDALAVQDIATRRGKQPPTVIVSGGAHVRSFLERPEIQNMLREAKQVIICGENEKDDKIQAHTDAGHKKQAERVAEITGQSAIIWAPPPDQGKDLAEMNVWQTEQIERTEQAIRAVNIERNPYRA